MLRAILLLLVVLWTSAPPQPTQGASCDSDLLCLVNETRQRFGLPLFSVSPELTVAADRHADDLAARGYLTHYSLNGDNQQDRAEDAGYTDWNVAEVAAWTESGPASVLHGWLTSPSHRSIILDPQYTTAGLGETRAGRRTYAVLDVGVRQ